MKKFPLVMVVLDGWGIGSKDTSNPIYATKPPNINKIRHTYPAGALQASGVAVGLPWGENGDSEVGHLTLGAGKVLYQHYPRISISIKDGTFFKNEELLGAIEYTKKNNSRLQIVGLIGKNNLNASMEHLEALLDLARREKAPQTYLHVFTDGRDSPQREAANLIGDLPQNMIASLSGRYFAMDKDLHWDRTAKAYNALTGASGVVEPKSSIVQFLNGFYERGLTDEFIEPTLIKPGGEIQNGDSIIFFNFREDSMRQLTEMFINPEVGGRHSIPQNLKVTTMTRYSSKFNVHVAFPPDVVTNPLGKVLSDNGRIQLRIAETEKYAHVTYFFNGLKETPFKNEYRVLIPSKNIARYDDSPEMMASQVTARALSALDEGVYDFILVNYANADIIGHTGNFDAAMKAIQVLDEQVGMLMKDILENGGILLITADHGNVEKMVDLQTGLPEMTHDPSPVPIYVVTKGYERTKTDAVVAKIERTKIGVISDVAPTVLELMGIPKPTEMTGVSLLQSLR